MKPAITAAVLTAMLLLAAASPAQSTDTPPPAAKPKAAPITALPKPKSATPAVASAGTPRAVTTPAVKPATSPISANPTQAATKPAVNSTAKAPTGSVTSQTTKPVTPVVGKLPAVATKPVAVASKPVAVAPKPATLPLLATATSPLPAAPVTGPLNRTTIVLDPAHGGLDSGSRLTDNLVEKDITLSLAFKLRSLLNARGFNVILLRDSDSATPANKPDSSLTLDDRAGLANRSRAVACLLLHATGSGAGVHLYNSELDAVAGEAATLPWLTAQAAWVTQSRNLSQKVGSSLGRAGVPLVTAAASIRPVDSLTCPALVVELAPATAGDPASITDSTYQIKVAEAIANAMVFWKNQAQPPVRLAAVSPAPASLTPEAQP